MDPTVRRLTWQVMVLGASLASGAAGQNVSADSLEIAAEVRAFLRDRADGNVIALVDHIWPAKIKPSSREDRGTTLVALARQVREWSAQRPEPAGCAAQPEAIDVALGLEWAVASVVTWRAAYAAAGENCVKSVELVPLQQVAGRWKVSGAMPEQREE